MRPYSYMYCAPHRDGVLQIILPNFGSVFQEQIAFVLKTVILLAFGLGICEEVGEDSRHGLVM